jgi:hypothetical protein
MPSKIAVVSSELEERLRFESMLTDLSSGFVNLETAKVDNEIEDAQRRVFECLDIDLAAGPPRVEIDDVASRRGFDLVEEILGRTPEKETEYEAG